MPFAVQLNFEQAQTAWFALTAYKDKLENDLASRYDGDTKFGDEDVDFLRTEIAKAHQAIVSLAQQGVSL